MQNKDHPERPASEEAMNAVLRAEQEALGAVEDCERKAAAIIHAAQQRARTIAERTHRRIGELHAHCARVTAAHIETLLREDASEANHANRREPEARTVEAAVDRVAARLTGEKQHDGPSR